MDNAISVEQSEHTPFESIQSTCGIPARKTGSVSLIIQAATFIVGIILVSMLFVHIGGYQKMFPRTPNVTEISSNRQIETTTSAVTTSTIETTNFTSDDITKVLNDTFETDKDLSPILLSNDENSTATFSLLITTNAPITDVTLQITKLKSVGIRRYIFHGPFEQIRDVIFRFGKRKLSLLTVLRCNCLVYFSLSLIWLLSMFALVASLKYEIIDLVFINTFALIMVSIFAFFKALLTGILIFYQYEFRWRTLLTICFSVGGLILCFIFNMVAFWMSVKWIRYINYMNGWDDSCLCISTIVKCIKGRAAKRRNRNRNSSNQGGGAPADYSIPEATRHANLPYIDDPPIQNFHNF